MFNFGKLESDFYVFAVLFYALFDNFCLDVDYRLVCKLRVNSTYYCIGKNLNRIL